MQTLVLDATTKSIAIKMSGAAATTNPDFVAAWADDNGTTFVEGSTDGALNGSSNVTAVAAPAASTRRVIKTITVQNRDTAAVTLTVQYNDNGTFRNIAVVTLQVNETWTTDGTYEANGGLKTGIIGPTGGTGPTGATGATGATGPSAVTVGSTVISGGTSTRILYNNGGVVGEYTISGTGTEIPTTHKPTFVGTIQTIVAVAALALDGALGNIFTKTIGSPSTFTQSNFSVGQTFIVKITGAFTPTWFSGITWITTGAAAPTQGAITTYGFVCTGSNTFDGYLVATQ